MPVLVKKGWGGRGGEKTISNYVGIHEIVGDSPTFQRLPRLRINSFLVKQACSFSSQWTLNYTVVCDSQRVSNPVTCMLSKFWDYPSWFSSK